VPAESLAIPLRQQGLLWARQILENKGRRRALASDEFAFDDLDHDGVLTKAEAFLSIQRVSRLVDLPLPKQERCDRLFDLCDKDSDGLLQPVEFRTYFKTLLGSAVRRGGKAIRTSAAIADAPAPSQARCSLKESSAALGRAESEAAPPLNSASSTLVASLVAAVASPVQGARANGLATVYRLYASSRTPGTKPSFRSPSFFRVVRLRPRQASHSADESNLSRPSRPTRT
jgi:hypothetical protein